MCIRDRTYGADVVTTTIGDYVCDPALLSQGYAVRLILRSFSLRAATATSGQWHDTRARGRATVVNIVKEMARSYNPSATKAWVRFAGKCVWMWTLKFVRLIRFSNPGKNLEGKKHFLANMGYVFIGTIVDLEIYTGQKIAHDFLVFLTQRGIHTVH